MPDPAPSRAVTVASELRQLAQAASSGRIGGENVSAPGAIGVAPELASTAQGGADMGDPNPRPTIDPSWLPVPDFPGYLVSLEGDIWSVGTNWRGKGVFRLTPRLDQRTGYYFAHLTCDGRTFKRSWHSVVCSAFYGPRPKGMYVRHLNGVKADNRPANLRWGTPKENAEDRDRHGTTARGTRNGWSVLSELDVLAIRHLRSKGMPAALLASYLNVHPCTVLRAESGQRYADVEVPK